MFKLTSRIFLFFSFCLLVLSANAQSYGTLVGRVTDSTGVGIELVNVSDSSGMNVFTSKDGSYEFKLPVGKEVVLLFSHPGYIQRKYRLTLSEKKKERLEVVMMPSTSRDLSTVTVIDNATDISLTRINPKILQFIPSASQDFNAILMATALGVANRNELSSSYSVRGGNFDENLVYVNGIEVYRPFLVRSGQQEGLSFVNSDMVSGILFSSGGFDAKYGDKMSSVLDITYRMPVKFTGTASGSLLGGSLHLEGVSKDTRFKWLLGARQRSNQYLLKTLDTKGDYKPSFTDVQAFLTYDLTDKWQLNFLGNYASNRYNFIPVNRETNFGTINEALRLKVYFDGQEVDRYNTMLGAVAANYRPDANTLMRFISSVYTTHESETFDIQGQYYISELEVDFGKPNFGDSVASRGVGTFLNHARNALSARVVNLEHKGQRKMTVNSNVFWGARYQHELIDDHISEWKMVDSAGYAIPLGSASTIDMQDVIKNSVVLSSSRLMGYGQYTFKKDLLDTSKVIITAGVRANYWTLNRQPLVSPRAAIAYKPNWKRDVILKFATGFYYQPPFYREMRGFDGNINRNLKAQQSIHFVLGSDMNFIAWKRPFKFVAEAYYKSLQHLVPYEVDNVRIRYFADNIAKGYATGLDLKVNGEFVKGVESWVSMSIMRTREDIINDYYYESFNSEGEKIIPGYTFNDVPVDTLKKEPGYIPRPTDQLVNFSLFFQDYFPRWPDFKMHLNLLFGTGLPYGPPTHLRYQAILRSPPYRRVDIGFSYQILKENRALKEKGWTNSFKSVWMSCEVFNLLGVSNTISYLWIKDISNRNYSIPNYLTGRQVNLKLVVKF